MIRRDYFLKLIERAGPMMRKIVGLRQADKKAEAQSAIEAACRELLNIDLRMAVGLAASDLGDLLSLDEGTAAAKLLVAADLLDEYGQAAGDPEQRAKALELYLRAWRAGGKAAVVESERFKGCLAEVAEDELSPEARETVRAFAGNS